MFPGRISFRQAISRQIVLGFLALVVLLSTVSCTSHKSSGGKNVQNVEKVGRASHHELVFLNTAVNAGGYEKPTIWIWSLDTGQIRQIAKGYGATTFTFNNDGNRFAFLGFPDAEKRDTEKLGNVSKELWLYDLPSGTITQITQDLWAAIQCHIAWRPGTEDVAVAREAFYRGPRPTKYDEGDGGLWLVNVSTGKMTQVIGDTDSEWPAHCYPKFSLDGSMLASLPYVVDMSTGNRRLVLSSPDPWFVNCSDWEGHTHNLLMGLSHARVDSVDNRVMKSKQGPGGVWKWELEKFSNKRQSISAFEHGKGIYSMAASHDGKRVAYLSASGLWVRDIEKNSSTRLLQPADLHGFSKISHDIDAYTDTSEYESKLSWSTDDKYIACSFWSGDLFVIDLVRREVVHPKTPLSTRFATWRPVSADK